MPHLFFLLSSKMATSYLAILRRVGLFKQLIGTLAGFEKQQWDIWKWKNCLLLVRWAECTGSLKRTEIHMIYCEELIPKLYTQLYWPKNHFLLNKLSIIIRICHTHLWHQCWLKDELITTHYNEPTIIIPRADIRCFSEILSNSNCILLYQTKFYVEIDYTVLYIVSMCYP